MKPAAISVRAAARKKQSSDRVYSKMQTKYKSSKGANDVKRLKRILALALTLLLLFGIMPSAAAESASATTLRLAAYSGSVSVANASGKSQTIKTDMRLYSGYTLATGKASAAYVSLDGT